MKSPAMKVGKTLDGRNFEVRTLAVPPVRVGENADFVDYAARTSGVRTLADVTPDHEIRALPEDLKRMLDD